MTAGVKVYEFLATEPPHLVWVHLPTAYTAVSHRQAGLAVFRDNGDLCVSLQAFAQSSAR